MLRIPQAKPPPFNAHGKPIVFVHYQSQQRAHYFLSGVLQDRRGVGLLYGPAASGKKTLIRQFTGGLPANLAVAVVDGARLKPAELLESILSRYGSAIAGGSADDLLRRLAAFVVEQTRSNEAPLLVVENINRMYPAALRALCQIASLRLAQQFAQRLILVSTHASYAIVHAPAMQAIANRMIGAFELGPMTSYEAMKYLYAKLRSSGCDRPDIVMPVEICDEFFRESAGWPGALDSLASLALSRAGNSPIRREHIHQPVAEPHPAHVPTVTAVEQTSEPGIEKLFLTLNGKTLQEFALKDSKILIGRSDLCDLVVNSRYVSKFHAMLIRSDNVLRLVDLNSSNGTFVNSRRVKIKPLRHEDIISLGNHGIKLVSPTSRARPVTAERDLADTATMKTLEDLRRMRAGGDAAIAPKKIRDN